MSLLLTTRRWLSNQPLKWTGFHTLSAAPSGAPCLPLKGSIAPMKVLKSLIDTTSKVTKRSPVPRHGPHDSSCEKPKPTRAPQRASWLPMLMTEDNGANARRQSPPGQHTDPGGTGQTESPRLTTEATPATLCPPRYCTAASAHPCVGRRGKYHRFGSHPAGQRTIDQLGGGEERLRPR